MPNQKSTLRLWHLPYRRFRLVAVHFLSMDRHRTANCCNVVRISAMPKNSVIEPVLDHCLDELALVAHVLHDSVHLLATRAHYRRPEHERQIARLHLQLTRLVQLSPILKTHFILRGVLCNQCQMQHEIAERVMMHWRHLLDEVLDLLETRLVRLNAHGVDEYRV